MFEDTHVVHEQLQMIKETTSVISRDFEQRQNLSEHNEIVNVASEQLSTLNLNKSKKLPKSC